MPNDAAMVVWNRPKFQRFTEAYKEAVLCKEDTGADVFEFEGNEFVVAYARYLIEFLDGKLSKK